MTEETKIDNQNNNLPASVSRVPLLPLRDIIVFPFMVVPLYVGREKSVKALEYAMKNGKDILLSAQKKAKTNDPQPEDIYEIGTLGKIKHLLRLPDSTVKVLVEGRKRVRIKEYIDHQDFFFCEIDDIADASKDSPEKEALVRQAQKSFEEYVKLNKNIPPEMIMSVTNIEQASRLADTIAAHLTLKLKDKQEILEIAHAEDRLEKLLSRMQSEIEILQIEKRIRSRVKKQMEKTQKEYYLNEQLSAIQKELGEKEDGKSEIQEIEDALKEKKLSKEAKEKVEKEVKKLKSMSPMSAEATVVRNYIDWMISLPWNVLSNDKIDTKQAQTTLDRDHYGLEKAKKRIVEYLAVQKLVDHLKGPILCLVGPPGVGKTSLARSIADATNRKFVKMSVGGMRDEAEIRGHRRTYIGAMPGKIIQSLKKAETSNPVFLIDEIDKMSMDFRGDPSAALLEVLDPEQNHSFGDHYLDVDYDLSKVMFVATANSLSGIPRPLMDRMEVISLSGYTEEEKLQIATKYLIPKQTKENGLTDKNITFTEVGIQEIIRRYTKEAGVRNLEREISSVSRKVAKDVVEHGKEFSKTITQEVVQDLLGIPKYRYGIAEQSSQVGLTNGLAWTEMGGDLLQIEVTVLPGKGKTILTGKLGEVMQESAQAAMSYIRSRSKAFGLKDHFYEKIDIHVHAPEGAIPKDGPSAGITMATSIASALLKIPVRRDIAMTGEITLRGKVLPIGGLKEKAMAAYRGTIREIIVPKENEKDLKDIPQNIRDDMKFHLVENADEVLKIALEVSRPEDLFKSEDQFNFELFENTDGEKKKEPTSEDSVVH
ncbi:MAG: endopeptidase La [Bdellovibrionales bacterium]|nr:endopeptidase La [Bdellovibrionales bacterium]